ncbi:unnamed protein product [Bursaphelenchus okinawaensis]|uniref:Innexin n=1 Tax=Bursaphelenchus okinawaensis TaxID=465554 RepID=A0A811LEL6_9BILA|nr:unnamed protein product [Bursaphelenchus okinawaensis]CAG9121617.1 unnamed protein product [Bursaphelenchus okinawaensis]
MLRYVGTSADRDFVDRINSFFTTNILIALAVLVSFKQFGGKPLECLTPDVFSGSWEEYAENFCWAQDTYSVPMSEIVDGMPKDEKYQRRISYYQWVPFFLLIEAACFRLPSLLWKYMSGHSGIKIQEICKLSSDPNNIKPDIKRANIRSLAVHLEGALRFHKRLNKKQLRPHNLLRMCNLPYSACYVTVTYLITKFCYLVNVLVQLFLMNKFLETDKYQFYGFGALLDLVRGRTWESSGVFPRIALCDFQVRVMGNIQEHTIQCVLVINIFNEKIFIFLWFWYVFLLLLTAGSFLYWLLVAIFPWPNVRFVKRHLEMSELDVDPDEKQKEVKRFVDKFLRTDGIFVLRMLTLHSGVIFGTEIVQELWQRHFKVELKRANSETKIGSPSKSSLFDSPSPKTNELRNRRYNEPQRFYPDIRRNSSVTEQLIAPPPPPDYVLRELMARSQANSPSTQSTSPTVQPVSPQPPANNNNIYEHHHPFPKPYHHFNELPPPTSAAATPITEPIREVPEPRQVRLTVTPTGPATAAVLRPYSRDQSPGDHLNKRSLEARPADPPRKGGPVAFN